MPSQPRAARRSKITAWGLGGFGALAVLSVINIGGNDSSSARATTPSRSLSVPEFVSSGTRSELKSRMGRHGATMSNLVRAVVLLDRPTVLTLAQRIADDEIVARAGSPTQGGRRLPLPFQFFTEQDALRAAAQQLAAAAAQGTNGLVASDAALADRFATVARTCVSCHSAYLHGRIELPP